LLGFLPRHGREKKNEELADQRRTAKPAVQVERVRRPKAGAGLVVPGTTTPFVEASIYARANGYLQRRLVDIGDHVHRGQLLAVIESPDLDQQVDQAREQVRQAQAQKAQQDTQLALTKITVDRFRVLVAKGVVSRQEGDQREADFRAQEANVNAAERNVEAFQANLRRVVALQSYERVTAPFDGVVTARNVDVGALISAAGSAGGSSAPSQSPQSGPTGSSAANSSGASGNAPTAASPSGAGGGGGPLFSIAQVDRLRILIAVPEGYASAIRTGAPAKLRFQELPSAEFSGKVTRTSLSIDQNTRTLLTEVQVDNRGGRLMTGMYTVVTFASLPGAAALTVPGDTIAIRNGRNVVGLVKDGRIHLQPVDVGRDFGPAVEIIGGLHEGDMIAASFTDDVRDNEEVEVQESKNPGEGSGANALPPKQTQPPGGSSQYGDQSVTDQNLQGQQAGQNKGQAAQKNSQGGSQH
jgi:multidrug efflux pump subunit AcrA (membrane-fusion protein)